MEEEFKKWFPTVFQPHQWSEDEKDNLLTAFLAGYDAGVTSGCEAQRKRDVEIADSFDTSEYSNSSLADIVSMDIAKAIEGAK